MFANTVVINLSCLDDSESIEATLQQHKAKWHDSCRLEYNKTKLNCAEKRKRRIKDTADASRKFTRILQMPLRSSPVRV